MPVINDKEKSKSTHVEGVEMLTEKMAAAGLKRLSDGHLGVMPQYSFTVSPVHRMGGGIMPRDFKLRLMGDTTNLKLYYYKSGSSCSSLYRATTYLLMSEGLYLQVVSGLTRSDFDKTFSFMDHGAFDPQRPAGIRHEDQFLEMIENAVSWR